MILPGKTQHLGIDLLCVQKDQHPRALSDQFQHTQFFIACDHDLSLRITFDQCMTFIAGQDTYDAADISFGIIINDCPVDRFGKVFRRCLLQHFPGRLGITQGQFRYISLGDPSRQRTLPVCHREGFPSGLFHFLHRLQDRCVGGYGQRLVEINFIHPHLGCLQKKRLGKMKSFQQIFGLQIHASQSAGNRIQPKGTLIKGIAYCGGDAVSIRLKMSCHINFVILCHGVLSNLIH